MIRTDVFEAINGVVDPELAGVTIGQLGLVHRMEECATTGQVQVELVPTFLGCPALAVIASDVERAAINAGASSCVVRFVTTVAWTPDRISVAGRRQLQALGIGVSGTGVSGTGVAGCCPDCGSPDVAIKSPVGATACRALAWCGSCRTPVELMRRPLPRDHARPDH